MQNSHTGQMVPLGFHDVIPERTDFEPFDVRRKRAAIERALQKAKDDAIPNRDHQGPVFFTGEELEIKGGRFRVAEIMATGLILQGIPAT
jgi:hypothetical protein